MKHLFFILLFFSSFTTTVVAQQSHTAINNDSVKTVNKKRFILIAGGHTVGYAGTLFILGQTWYKNYPKTAFHVFDDSKEWLQVDKTGHAWTAYSIAKFSTDMWRWTGLSERKSIIIGGASALSFQTILEFLDGHSAEWGWSWSDIGANFFGTGLFVSQQLGWKEQRLQFKFSSHRNRYAAELEPRADFIFGKTLPERLLKDYNAQTYWLSFNLKSFIPDSHLPAWLNLSVGYGADGLFGGFNNIAYDKNGNIIFDRTDIPRRRQWYLAPDIDFTKIKTNKPFLRKLLSVLNMIKMPAPALELSGGKFKLKAIAF